MNFDTKVKFLFTNSNDCAFLLSLLQNGQHQTILLHLKTNPNHLDIQF